MCKMNKWQFLPRDLWFLKWKALEASSCLYASLRLQTSSEDFGRLRKTSDFFGRLHNSSGIFGNDRVFFRNPTHPREKSLTLISHKKLAGITFENTLRVPRLAGERMSKHCSNNVETKHYIDTKPFRYRIRNADNENVSQLHNQFLWVFL